jgi:hypothetical protein
MQAQNAALQGYPALAQVMGPHPSMAIFKRFATLNARSLLMQQAELLLLQRELDVMMASDQVDGLPYDTNAEKLIDSAQDGPDDAQLTLVLDIRGKLEKYSMISTRVMQHSQH